jgi:hypothetical protein
MNTNAVTFLYRLQTKHLRSQNSKVERKKMLRYDTIWLKWKTGFISLRRSLNVTYKTPDCSAFEIHLHFLSVCDTESTVDLENLEHPLSDSMLPTLIYL